MHVHVVCMRTYTRDVCTHTVGLRMHALCMRMHSHAQKP